MPNTSDLEQKPELQATSNEIREVYAHYGLAMYCAQLLEIQLAMTLTFIASPVGITAWDYDSRIAGYRAVTFGSLVNTFAELVESKAPELTKRLRSAVETRNFLAHSYFWDRASKYSVSTGCAELIEELGSYRAEFDSLEENLTMLADEAARRRGIDTEELRQRSLIHAEKLLAGHPETWNPEQVPKSVTVTSARLWNYLSDDKHYLVLLSQDGKYLIPGERGLCFGPPSIPTDMVEVEIDYGLAFPVSINPRPKIEKPWFFEIPLAEGWVLKAHLTGQGNTAQFTVRIQKPQRKQH